MRPMRISGLLSVAVCLVMCASDLLMLSTLDFSRPYDYWAQCASLPQRQVTLGYLLGELTIPLDLLCAWHLALAVRPAGRWAQWLVVGAIAYCAPLLSVWHASFAFARSILRAEAGRGGTPETDLAFDTYSMPLFRVALVVAGATLLVVGALIVAGRSHYPRWAVVPLAAAPALVLLGVSQLTALPWQPLLRPAKYNVAEAVLFLVSTAILWDLDG